MSGLPLFRSMNQGQAVMPGYKLNEYLLVLNPHEELRNKIMGVKKDFSETYKTTISLYRKPFVTLASFKQLEMVEQSHDGKVNDFRWGVRMRGEGNIAQMVAQQYKKYGLLYNMNAEEWSLDTSRFCVPGEQGKLF